MEAAWNQHQVTLARTVGVDRNYVGRPGADRRRSTLSLTYNGTPLLIANDHPAPNFLEVLGTDRFVLGKMCAA